MGKFTDRSSLSICVLQPFMPNQKGKIERFFRTVRSRFLSKIDTNNIKDIDELNEKHFLWLEEDYQRKQHSSLGMSPLDFFMSQVSKVKMVSDVKQLNEAFLLRVSRKINKDATFALEKILYETEQIYAGKRLEVRYDPEWINSSSVSVLLYHEGKKIGEARKVKLHENAHVKRKFGINRKKDKESEVAVREYENSSEVSESYYTSINYSKMMNNGEA
jgi:putative transposase